METRTKFKQALLALAAIAVPLQPLAAQNEVELQDSGLTFTIRNMTLEHEGDAVVFRAILDNRTKEDWYMRSAIITVNAACKSGSRRLDFKVHFTNPDLLGMVTTYSDSIRPGQNDIVKSVRADQTCKFDSLGPVVFRGLRTVDASTQQALDADRRRSRELHELNREVNERLDLLDRYQERLCHEVYAATATRRVSDLTVKEAQDVRACQEAGYYK